MSTRFSMIFCCKLTFVFESVKLTKGNLHARLFAILTPLSFYTRHLNTMDASSESKIYNNFEIQFRKNLLEDYGNRIKLRTSEFLLEF